MPQLSSPLSEMKSHYQIVVIGSGYGGSIAASRLARAGQQVCLLERGREIQAGEFPNNELELGLETRINFPAMEVGFATALNEYHVNEDMTVLVGCGLGGTSLINGNVALRADSRVFEHPRWPQAIRDDLDTRVAEGYTRAEKMLGATPYPDSFPPLHKYDALKKSADALGLPVYKAPITVTFEDGPNAAGVEQKACKLCGDCMSGCNYHAKNSTHMNYLPDAKKHGAEIFTCANVETIERNGAGWTVHFSEIDNFRGFSDWPKHSVTADIVILAAGTMGSNKIMLRSKEAGLSLSDELGKRFSGNGDVGGFAYNGEHPVQAVGTGPDWEKKKPVGPLIVGVIDTRAQAEDWRDGAVIQEGTFPSATALPLPVGLSTMSKALGKDTDRGFVDGLKERFRRWVSVLRGPHYGAVRNTLLWLVTTHDNSNGRLKLKDDRIRIEWPDSGEQPYVDKVSKLLEDGTKAHGGNYVPNPLWALTPGEPMVTAHPIGGCSMAEDASQGVVNHKGQVFSGSSGTEVYEGLYVCDSASVPHSIGVNLALTVAALAERSMALLAEEKGWTIDYS